MGCRVELPAREIEPEAQRYTRQNIDFTVHIRQLAQLSQHKFLKRAVKRITNRILVLLLELFSV